MERYTLGILVNNNPGVLSRVVGHESTRVQHRQSR